MNDFMRSTRQWSTVLLVALAVFLETSLLWAQAKDVDQGKSVGAQVIQTFPVPEPDADRAAIDEHKKILRAEIAMDSSTSVRFYEEPTSEAVYDSSISVERDGRPIATYKIGRMIKHQALRLVHAALIRSGDTSLLVCEYEGGAIGAREGFAILKFSSLGFELHTLPLTEFGKVVVFRGNPERAEIWSALPDDAASDASNRFYVTQVCHWRSKGYVCEPQKRQARRFLPGDIDDPGIEIR